MSKPDRTPSLGWSSQLVRANMPDLYHREKTQTWWNVYTWLSEKEDTKCLPEPYLKAMTDNIVSEYWRVDKREREEIED